MDRSVILLDSSGSHRSPAETLETELFLPVIPCSSRENFIADIAGRILPDRLREIWYQCRCKIIKSWGHEIT